MNWSEPVTGAVAATSQHEIPGFFPAGREWIFGILTRPTVEPVGTAVVLVPTGAGTRDSINRNRLWVRLARRAAGLGYHAVRFDYHGAGESTGIEDQLRIDRPIVQDLDGAVEWVKSQGVAEFILVGSCYGARAALSYAPGAPGLRGLVLATPYLRDMAQGERVATLRAIEWSLGQYLRRAMSVRVLRRLRDRDKRRAYGTVAKRKVAALGSRLLGRRAERASPNFLDPLGQVLDRNVPVLFLYGEQDDAYEEFEASKGGRFGRLLERHSARVDVDVLPGRLHAFSTVQAQDAAMERITNWLAQRLPSADMSG
jgi:dienelactone hydrolase